MRDISIVSAFVIVSSAVIIGLIVLYAAGPLFATIVAMLILIAGPIISSFLEEEKSRRGRNRRQK